jgi:hypothetical protein
LKIICRALFEESDNYQKSAKMAKTPQIQSKATIKVHFRRKKNFTKKINFSAHSENLKFAKFNFLPYSQPLWVKNT